MRKVYFALFVFSSYSLSAQNFFDKESILKNLKILSSDSMQGRRTGTPGSLKAAHYIKTQFLKSGVLPIGKSYELPFEFHFSGKPKSGMNLAGIIKGKSSSGKYIVVSAHYDHEGVKNGNIYNGADDNASGVSVLFAIAEYLKANPPLHNVMLVAFDAEELGLLGAQAFVQNPPVSVTDIMMNINMDMVSRADKNELVACGTFYYPQLKSILEKVKSEPMVRLIQGHDDPSKFKGEDNWTFASDHGPFHSLKIPFIYFGVDDHADYHQPGDDFEKINPETYISCVNLIIKVLIELDKGLT